MVHGAEEPIMHVLSKITTVLCHPLLMPAYCTLITLFGNSPYAHGFSLPAFTFIIVLMGLVGCLCPLMIIGIYMFTGHIKELEMNSRQERVLPCITIGSLGHAAPYSARTPCGHALGRSLDACICWALLLALEDKPPHFGHGRSLGLCGFHGAHLSSRLLLACRLGFCGRRALGLDPSLRASPHLGPATPGLCGWLCRHVVQHVHDRGSYPIDFF